MKSKLKHSLLSGLLILLGSPLCGCKQTEKTEAITAGIEAAQIEGRNAAKRLIKRTWTDSTERIADMQEIDSISRSYNDTASARLFKETFNSTLRTVRPDLYRQLHPESSESQ